MPRGRTNTDITDKAMEARELFSEIEAFVTRAKAEAMTKPGINSDGHTFLIGRNSKYRDPEQRGSCSVYFHSDYFVIEITKSEVFHFRADISKGVVGFDIRNALSYEEHKEDILSVWERAIARTTLSLYEQALESLIVQREIEYNELKAIDRKIGELKREIKNSTEQ